MSAKWRRSLAWEQAHLTGPWTPLRWLLHTLSTIWLAVILLSGVALYAVAASVPVGVLLKAPTWAFYALTLVLTVALVALPAAWMLTRWMSGRGHSRAARFVAGFAALLVLGFAGVVGWNLWIWPALKYDAAAGTGVMFFADTIAHYREVTVRRLPGFEMTEMQFYAWWPLTSLLLIFVLNMTIATVRRIEMRFENLGVLTVHTGIVVLALGACYYSVAKLEGDMILPSGSLDPATGQRAVGPPSGVFFDNARVVLNVSQRGARPGPAGPGRAEPRLLTDLPRYNEYNLGALRAQIGELALPAGAPGDEGRTLDLPVESNLLREGQPKGIDPDLRVRVVGYAPVARPQQAWDTSPAGQTEPAGPARLVTVQAVRRDPATGQIQRRDLPDLMVGGGSAADRVDTLFDGLFVLTYTRGMPQEQWDLLRASMPDAQSLNFLHVRLPGQTEGTWHAVAPGTVIRAGQPAWTFRVQRLEPQPSMPFVTRGYESVSSPEMIVQVEPPDGYTPPGATEPLKPFTRFIFTRYPELNQDLGPTTKADGRPDRRPPTPLVALTHVDASVVSVYIDEPADATRAGGEPAVRALVRLPGRDPIVLTNLRTGSTIPIGEPEAAILTLAARFDQARKALAPFVVPSAERRGDTGTHKQAMVAVEISRVDDAGKSVWSSRRWLPFSEFDPSRPIDTASFYVPDGRVVDVSFGRLRHQLPDLEVALAEFEMIPYPHSTVPRDYRSDLVVTRVLERDASGSPVRTSQERLHTSLNDPLLVSPFVWSEQRGLPGNVLGWLADRLGPTRFKFSQAGWDSDGWTSSLRAVEQGQLKRPSARFTRLGVGNNPGIYVIAAGAIMLSLGIPWAFYVKPWILRRRKAKIQRQLAEGTYAKPAPRGPAATLSGAST